MNTRRGLVAALAVGVAGITYSSWVVESLFPAGLDPLRSSLSELAADGRPFRLIYVTGDVVTAVVALIAAAAFLLPRPLADGLLERVAVIAFGCFGAATLADALYPIGCIPNLDPGCPAVSPGLFPQLHHIHALTSSIAVISLFIAVGAATLAAARGGEWRAVRRPGAAVAAVMVAATAWMLIAANLSGDYWVGLAQRIQVGAMSVWMITWAVALGSAASQSATSRRLHRGGGHRASSR